MVLARGASGSAAPSRLASAYGVAVMGTMLVTTLLTFFVLRYGWRYPLWLCVLATAFFALVDVVFFAAAMHKVLEGGWFPLALGALVFTIMVTWRRGRETLLEQPAAARRRHWTAFLNRFSCRLRSGSPGTAVFLTSAPDATPIALLHSLKHYKVLHERNVFMTVEFRDVPWVEPEERVACERLPHDCWRVNARYGFMEQPDVARALELCGRHGLQLEPMDVSYFLSREKIVPAGRARGLALWRDLVFSAMARNAGERHGFLQHSAQPRRGAWNADRDLSCRSKLGSDRRVERQFEIDLDLHPAFVPFRHGKSSRAEADPRAAE